MATIEDLDFKSLTEMSHDEAIEHIRQIRLSRRTPVTKPKKETKTAKATEARKVATKNLSPDLAKELLGMLEK